MTEWNDGMWAEASADHEAMAREAALALADAELETVMPFLLASRSDEEYVHRSALAQESISSIAAHCGLDESELIAVAGRRYRLYREALAEGTDPMVSLEPLLNGGPGGPEKPDEHDEGPDFSHGYSEVPQGAPGGPDPGVTWPRPPAAGPVQEAAGSLRRQADASPGMMTAPYQPMAPDTGTGAGSVDMSTPAANGGGMSPSLPAGVTSNGDDTLPIPPPSIGKTTSSADPVRRKVMAVTAAVAAVNPQLPATEAERVARQIVGRYFREADLNGSVMNDEPVSDSSSSGGSGSGSDSGGGLVQHGLEWQGLKSMLPGGAAEAAPELAELAPAALAL
jgi:hypothetical protein